MFFFLGCASVLVENMFIGGMMSIDVSGFPDIEPLQYETARPQIRTGDMLLCSGKFIAGTLIRALTRSAYGHIGLLARIVVGGIERVVVIESVMGGGVRMVQLSNYVRDYNGSGRGYAGKLLIARDNRFVEQSDGDTFLNHGFVRQGYLYDWDSVLRLIIRITGARFGLTFSSLERDNEYLCSELAQEMYESVGLTYTEDPAGFIAPHHFALHPDVHPVMMLKTE